MLVCICSADCRRLSNPGSCVSDTKCIGSKMEKFTSLDAIRSILLFIEMHCINVLQYFYLQALCLVGELFSTVIIYHSMQRFSNSCSCC